MNENLKLQIAVLIKNTISLTLWIVLAIAFNKWWIALFSILFLTSVEKEKNKEWYLMLNEELQEKLLSVFDKEVKLK